MENLNFLLKKLSILNQRFRMQSEVKEVFNVFDSMMKRTDEKNLHSRFISILLDPKATHNTEDTFLKLFLQSSGIKFNYTLNYLETYPNESQRSEYKNIDILLIDRHTKSAAIIENKIKAPDSNHEEEGQLEKYYRIILEEGIPSDSISVIYLTLDRERPSIESIATSKLYPELMDKVITINYGKHILDWLRECSKVVYDKPFIREVIIQYSNLIENMTKTSISEAQVKEIMDIIGQSRDNLRGTQLLINNIAYIQATSIWYFWSELTIMLKEIGYSIRKPIAEQDCQNLIYGNLRSSKIDFNLEVTSKKGSNLTVNVSYKGCLCVGVTEKDGKEGQYHNALSFYHYSKESLSLDQEKGWCFYKIIFFPIEFCENIEIFDYNPPSLDFIDYNNDLYVNLISLAERTKIITYIVKEIEMLTTEYETFRNN